MLGLARSKVVASKDAEYVRAGAKKIATFASEQVGEPWHFVGAVQSKVPSRWAVEKRWAFRTAIAAALGMAYACLAAVHQARWSAVHSLAPILAIANVGLAAAVLPAPCVGSVLLLSKLFLCGSVVGSCCAVVCIEIARALPFAAAGKDYALFALYCCAVLFVVSRSKLHLVMKKLACVVLSIATFAQAASGHAIPWAFPLCILTPCAVGCVAALLAALLPWPVAAVDEIRRRAAYHGQVLRALLGTQEYLVLTNDVAALSHAETLLESLASNAAAMKKLLALAHVEMECAPRCPGFAGTRLLRAKKARLAALVRYVDAMVAPCRGKQFALRGRRYGGPDTISAAQVKFLAMVCEPFEATRRAVCDHVEAVVALETSLDGGVPYGVASLAARDVTTDAVRTSGTRLEDAIVAARHAIFYSDGPQFVAANDAAAASASAAEHCRRMAHMWFNKYLLDAVERTPNFLEVPETAVHPVPAVLRGWGPYCGRFFRDRTRGGQFREDVKKAIALGLAGILGFVPFVRHRVAAASTAAVTISFIFTENVGGAYKTGKERLVGTLFGAVFALIFATICAEIVSDVGTRVATVALVALWAGALATKFDYSNVVAAFTAASIMVACLWVPDPVEAKAEALSVQAIKMNTLGALLFFVVETQLWARSSRETIVGGVPTILRDVGLGVEEGLAPFRPAAADAVEVRDDGPPPPGAAAAMAARCAKLAGELESAEHEPQRLARFPRANYEAALDACRGLAEILAALLLVSRDADVGAMPPSVAPAFALFGRQARDAVDAAADAWAAAGAPVVDMNGDGVVDELDKEMFRVNSVAAVATPLVGFAARVLAPLLDERDQLVRRAAERTQAETFSPTAITTWMTTTFLCMALSDKIDDLGTMLRTIRAKEVFKRD